MDVIITMAGLGSRFRQAGYNCPKYMIEAKGKTLFDWSMDSLIGYNKNVDRYVFVVRAEDHAEEFIKKHCAAYGIYDVKIVESSSQSLHLDLLQISFNSSTEQFRNSSGRTVLSST